MEKDKHITEVVFRKDGMIDNKGEIYALFPHLAENKSGCVSNYQHVGQHSIADFDFLYGYVNTCQQNRICRPAKRTGADWIQSKSCQETKS